MLGTPIIFMMNLEASSSSATNYYFDSGWSIRVATPTKYEVLLAIAISQGSFDVGRKA